MHAEDILALRPSSLASRGLILDQPVYGLQATGQRRYASPCAKNTFLALGAQGDIAMGSKLTVSIGLIVLLLGAADAFAFSSGGRSRGDSSSVAAGSQSSSGGGGVTASLPEPSTLYAVGTALALLGGAGWYIRRRK